MLQHRFCSMTALAIILFAGALQATPPQKPASDAGKKPKMVIHSGDAALTISGKTRIDHFYQDNAAMLNANIPDGNEYFKHSLNVIFDFSYGEKKFGHKAVQMYTDLRHKSIWGKALSYADKESGPTSPAVIKLSETAFGSHSHSNGKPLMWMTESWVQFSINALFNDYSNWRHFFKIGWFPFKLGRGIALGAAYGLNKEILGLYSYGEEKSAPGINLSGALIEKWVDYDLYYAKFEERDKGFSDTISSVRRHWIGHESTPWRGTGKDDQLFAARLKIYPIPAKYGALEIEPYWFFNDAKDQSAGKEIAPDVNTKLHSVGCSLEYNYNKQFEFGCETAFNFGTETLPSIDRNLAQLVNQDGHIVETYSHILNTSDNKPALVTDTTKALASNSTLRQNGITLDNNYKNSATRIRPCYENLLRGWMAVADAAYSIPSKKLSFAVAYGIASGDRNPHVEEKNKTYKEFIGLHEFYTGKRVKSYFLLDQRILKRPTALISGKTQAESDLRFSDLEHVGLALNWKPNIKEALFTVNPNLMFFWKEFETNKFDKTTSAISLTEKADKFMGTELNLALTATPVKDLTFQAVFAVFLPGQYFKDVAGVPLSDDFIKNIPAANAPADLTKFRISYDPAYHINLGLSYSF